MPPEDVVQAIIVQQVQPAQHRFVLSSSPLFSLLINRKTNKLLPSFLPSYHRYHVQPVITTRTMEVALRPTVPCVSPEVTAPRVPPTPPFVQKATTVSPASLLLILARKYSMRYSSCSPTSPSNRLVFRQIISLLYYL